MSDYKFKLRDRIRIKGGTRTGTVLGKYTISNLPEWSYIRYVVQLDDTNYRVAVTEGCLVTFSSNKPKSQNRMLLMTTRNNNCL